MTELEKLRAKIRNLDGDEFITSIISLCSDLQSHHNILTFGFIIYDETTPEYRKVLRDKDYWEALDRTSGDKMMIFALSDKADSRTEGLDTVEFMTSFRPTKKIKTKSYSHLLAAVFKDESLLVYPSVLFFQVYNGLIFNYRLVPLQRGDIWDSFSSVQGLFKSISQALERIAPENYQNYREIFEQVREELLRQKYTMYILNGPKTLADFIGLIKNLLFFL